MHSGWAADGIGHCACFCMALGKWVLNPASVGCVLIVRHCHVGFEPGLLQAPVVVRRLCNWISLRMLGLAQGKAYMFMMRTKQPAGVVSNQLYLTMDDLADQVRRPVRGVRARAAPTGSHEACLCAGNGYW